VAVLRENNANQMGVVLFLLKRLAKTSVLQLVQKDVLTMVIKFAGIMMQMNV
jgi:hypothetical protein